MLLKFEFELIAKNGQIKRYKDMSGPNNVRKYVRVIKIE